MNRLRNRLVLVFLAATLPPLAATLWIANSLIGHSLSYSSTAELDRLSRTLEATARQFYQRERDALRAQVRQRELPPEPYPVTERHLWPAEILEFWESEEQERFILGGDRGDKLHLLVRESERVLRYSRELGAVQMQAIRKEYAEARRLVEQDRSRDLRRGFLYTFLILAALPWLATLGLLVFVAGRISRPIHRLAAALRQVAAGDLSTRLEGNRNDEVGAAMAAFNRMTEELQQSRERLLYLARVESWQALARKTAHEIKNSLTPIRLTMEELAARRRDGDSFENQAAQIVVDEVNSLERRVRAFSEFAAEPPVQLRALDANTVLEERLLLLQSAHPDVDYRIEPNARPALVTADEDLLKAVLTNLLENAADAAGPGGRVLVRTSRAGQGIAIDVHDSGPGLSAEAMSTLFEPAISFKKGGMGLGLSIARKSALLSGGDIVLVKGELGGAGFRVLLPATCLPGAS